MQFTVLGLLVFNPCKPIISIRQETNYMQYFHSLAKKINCLYFRTGCGFFDKMLVSQKTQASDLSAGLPGCLSGVVLSFQIELVTNSMFLMESLNHFPGLFLCFAFVVVG